MKLELDLRHPGNTGSIVRELLKRSVTVVIVFGFLALARFAYADGSVLLIERSWIREAPPGVPTLAAYMNITNSTDSPVSILGVSSNIAKMTELHEVKMENDMMQMRKMTEVVLDQGETLELKTGGSHIMLMGVQESFQEGDEIQIEFTLKDHPVIRVMVPVKKDQ